jgi:hypothetical protein
MSASWAEFEASAPELTALGRSCIYFYGPGLGFLATVRPDGGPRLHPVCPSVVDGALWVLVGDSPKRRDLERDPRFALHTFPQPEVDDEFYLRGEALRDADTSHDESVRAAMKESGINTGDDDHLYELRIDRALHSKYEHRGQWPPEYTKWRAVERGTTDRDGLSG